MLTADWFAYLASELTQRRPSWPGLRVAWILEPQPFGGVLSYRESGGVRYLRLSYNTELLLHLTASHLLALLGGVAALAPSPRRPTSVESAIA